MNICVQIHLKYIQTFSKSSRVLTFSTLISYDGFSFQNEHLTVLIIMNKNNRVVLQSMINEGPMSPPRCGECKISYLGKLKKIKYFNSTYGEKMCQSVFVKPSVGLMT